MKDNPLLKIDLSWKVVNKILTKQEIEDIQKVYTPEKWDTKLSIANKIGALPSRLKSEIYSTISPEDVEELKFSWEFMGRPSQIKAITSTAGKILFMAGRGAGKTWAGGHYANKKAEDYPGQEGVILTRTAGDFKTVVKAIQEACPEHKRPVYKKMDRRIEWPNGSYAILTSSERPDQLRGPNGYWGWADEAAFLKDTEDASGMTALRNLFTCVRMGDNPQVFLSTTPKRSKAMNEIMEEANSSKNSAYMVHATTFDNTALPPSYVQNVLETYKGNKQLARQELFGEIISASGTVFDEESLLNSVLKSGEKIPDTLPIRFVAVDPSVSDKKGDLCGIVVIGCTAERDHKKRTAYVLEEASMQGKPDEWARKVVELCKKHNTKSIVYEKNQGGNVISVMFSQMDKTLKTFPVHASRGKLARAEPVALAVTQGRVKFAEEFIELINEAIQFDPDTTKKSPDRMDAFVWGITACLISPEKGLGGVVSRTYNPASSNINLGFGYGKARGHTQRHQI